MVLGIGLLCITNIQIMINDGDCHPTLTPPDGLIWQRGFEICDKMKICVTLKFSGMKTPSAGEFIRWVA